ncbi:MAG: hypothetical protein KC422_26170 [Trueperaceae bacterium]|nr:hypothetical protein [Trueperaceae bacterium]
MGYKKCGWLIVGDLVMGNKEIGEKCNVEGSIVDFVMQGVKVSVKQAGLKLQSLLEPIKTKVDQTQQLKSPTNLNQNPNQKKTSKKAQLDLYSKKSGSI